MRTGRAPLPWPASTLVVVALLAVATVISIVIHVFMEKPITGRLRRWLLHEIESEAVDDRNDPSRVPQPPLNIFSRHAPRTHAGAKAVLRHGLSEGRG